MQFKLGDIVKMKDNVALSAGHAAPACFKYIVLGVGKYPGYVTTYCIKGPKRWLGNTYNFNVNSVEKSE